MDGMVYFQANPNISRGKTLVPVKHPFKKHGESLGTETTNTLGGIPKQQNVLDEAHPQFFFPTKTYSDLKLNCQSLLSHNIIITFKGCYEKNYCLAGQTVLVPWFCFHGFLAAGHLHRISGVGEGSLHHPVSAADRPLQELFDPVRCPHDITLW